MRALSSPQSRFALMPSSWSRRNGHRESLTDSGAPRTYHNLPSALQNPRHDDQSLLILEADCRLLAKHTDKAMDAISGGIACLTERFSRCFYAQRITTALSLPPSAEFLVFDESGTGLKTMISFKSESTSLCAKRSIRCKVTRMLSRGNEGPIRKPTPAMWNTASWRRMF